ncbi:cytochrome ubiquinol oxidase subunit I [Thermicanus aegyptius]|uniref:cytochrome ubiquinol oxidase subunit I n=1 Tax=Thermicanus aegyptius TaxID=94009 RepID=UPI00042314C7|nr:cytochrome ubiquinol oxidase subunit I [Thermicanus aegyptius]
MSGIVALSRWQFGLTAFFHFLFVPLTIGLVILVAIMETLYARKKEDIYRRMADFWGKLFAINFALGVVTGITMEFQFGTNWSEYSKFMGDIFGSPLAIEALLAFFLESTFFGVWFFGRNKFSPKLRAFSMWMVAIGTNISALWIITANGFMQNPVGYSIVDGKIQLENFGAVMANPYVWYMFTHTIFASYIVGSFFVLGVSAYHLLRKHHLEFFTRSFKMALIMAVISTLMVPIIGHFHGVNTGKVNPVKAAAFEAVWETGKDLPFYLFQIPDPANERNSVELLGIPYLGSLFNKNDIHGEVKGLKEVPAEERPNVSVVFWSFRLMIGLGLYFLFMAIYGFYLYSKQKLLDSSRYLKVLLYTIPLPYVAINLGWVVAEMGRQPWIVFGLMKTDEAVSPIAMGEMIFSMVGLFLFYGILIISDLRLLRKYAVAGPENDIPGETPKVDPGKSARPIQA